MAGSETDITARKRAEEALRESEERFRLLADSSPVLIWVNGLDRCEFVNRAYLNFLGVSPVEVQKLDWAQFIHPDDREEYMNQYLAASARPESFAAQFRFRRVDGEYRWMKSVGLPRFSATGEFQGYVGSTLDITDIKEAEAAVRESESRFRNMADHAPVMVWVTEADATCSFLSKSWYEFIGHEPETGLGRGRLNVVHPDDQEYAENALLAAHERREGFRLEYRLRREDGEYRWVIDSARPRFGRNGEFLGYIGSVIDITERKRMEDALKEADRRKDEFLAMLSHELRNPLAAIRNAAHVLKLIGGEDANQQQVREVIERQTQGLARLMDDLLDVSRIAHDKVTLKREPVDLVAIIKEAVETSRPLIDARRHQLTVALPPAPLRLEGDFTRLVQVISNLLNNAAKYTDEGGQIRLEAAQENREAVIRIRDNGMGMPADLLPHVFDLFTQADRSLDRSQGGLGIGLTLVRRLVEMHGGRVKAESPGRGQGSEFIVRLPVSAGVEEAATEAPSGERAGAASSALKILLVEDNADSAEMLKVMLKLGGHEVRTARNGPEALEATRQFEPQAVLCDIGLPGMNGYEVAARLRERPSFRQTPLIALTGYGQEEARIRAKEAGFDYHLVKPVEPEALDALLNTLRAKGQGL